MKVITKSAISKIIIVLIFAIPFLALVIISNGWFASQMTSAKAQKIFERVGGVEKVNQEAARIFNRLGTNENELHFLSDSDLKDCPAISAIGHPTGIWPEAGQFPTSIQIRYGSHMYAKTIYIFDPNKVMQFHSPSNYIQVTSNILISK